MFVIQIIVIRLVVLATSACPLILVTCREHIPSLTLICFCTVPSYFLWSATFLCWPMNDPVNFCEKALCLKGGRMARASYKAFVLKL